MKLKHHLRAALGALGLLALVAANAQDNSVPPPAAPPTFSVTELEKLAAPIAMHPDPLIAILLPASVYPLEIVQAARFVKDTNNLPKVDAQSWDDNVKAVAKFPELIAMMDADLAWTSDLGEAFLDQQKELMDTIQALRAKAQTLGTLKTTPQQTVTVTNFVVLQTNITQVVTVTNQVVQVIPANPQVVYVPTYPPSMYYYYPPPVYVGPPPVVTFAVGVTVGLIIANNCDWHHGGIYVGHHGVAIWGGGGYHGHGGVNINGDVNINTGNNFNNSGNINSGNNNSAQKWQPDRSRISKSGASGTRSSTRSATARGWSSGAASTGGMRPNPAPAVNRPATRPANSTALRSSSPPSAFGGVSNGASTRQSSNRGSYSRGGGGERSGGGRGR